MKGAAAAFFGAGRGNVFWLARIELCGLCEKHSEEAPVTYPYCIEAVRTHITARVMACALGMLAVSACEASFSQYETGGHRGTASAAGDAADAAPAAAVSASADGATADPVVVTDTWLLDPNYAQTFVTNTNPASLSLSGVSRQAGVTATLQISDLSQATETWVTIASGTTAIQATAVLQEQLYAFDFKDINLNRTQWPKNGVARLRVMVGNSASVSFDASRNSCQRLTSNQTFTEFAKNCSTNRPFVSVVDVSRDAPLTTNDYLLPPSPTDLLAKQVDAQETNRYLRQTGLLDRVPTLAKFQQLYNLGGPGAGTKNDISAIYYNFGDLGFGREMHCNKSNDGVIGCAVTNYGQPGGDATIALNLALSQNTPIATVAMEYRPSAVSDPVTFMVYDGAGNPLTEAALDSEGAKATPLICVSCHGGTYDPNTHSISGTNFLPFDTDELLYANTKGFTLNEQADKFRQLNAIVAQTNPIDGIKSVIAGWYGTVGVNTQGNTLDNTFVPAGWADQKDLYRNVVKPYCRSCHNSLAAPLSWPTSADFIGLKAQIQDDVCNRAAMPRSEQTVRHFWQSGASASLVDALKLQTSCAPQ